MKKRTITYILMHAIVSILLIACQQKNQMTPLSTQVDDSKISRGPDLEVLVVESFIADITRNVTGDRLEVETLMPLGLDPHAFEPTPQDVAKVAESQVLIVNGAGFEEWLQRVLENAGGERTVIEASAGLTSREAREGEEAVMSPEEKAEQVCLALADKITEEEVATGDIPANAVELHGESEHETKGEEHAHEAKLLALKLNSVDSGYAGFVRFDVTEDGDYVIAANGGTLTVTDAKGAAIEVEETLPVNCAGLNGGILLDLEPGEYIISLIGLADDTTPFFAGSAGMRHHHEGDPHFWLDPMNAVKYVENIRDGLSQVDPAGQEFYAQNAAAYINQLNELDGWIQMQVAQIPVERRLIITNHESFGYFADRYGFKIIGTIIPSISSGASPSAQQLARLVDSIRSSKAIAIFLETGANPQLAEQISEETGIRVVTELYSHSITPPGGKAPTYLDMMRYNVDAIVTALK